MICAPLKYYNIFISDVNICHRSFIMPIKRRNPAILSRVSVLGERYWFSPEMQGAQES